MIDAREEEGSIISVGSHDIHEKEFQVYFDRKVLKTANDSPEETKLRLVKLFEREESVFCLLTEKDYISYLGNFDQEKLEIIYDDYMVRKRLKLDKDFYIAILRFDQKTINEYLKERILLVYRHHA